MLPSERFKMERDGSLKNNTFQNTGELPSERFKREREEELKNATPKSPSLAKEYADSRAKKNDISPVKKPVDASEMTASEFGRRQRTNGGAYKSEGVYYTDYNDYVNRDENPSYNLLQNRYEKSKEDTSKARANIVKSAFGEGTVSDAYKEYKASKDNSEAIKQQMMDKEGLSYSQAKKKASREHEDNKLAATKVKYDSLDDDAKGLIDDYNKSSLKLQGYMTDDESTKELQRNQWLLKQIKDKGYTEEDIVAMNRYEESLKNAENAEIWQDVWDELYEESPVYYQTMGTIASAGTNVLKALAPVENIIANVTDTPVDKNSPFYFGKNTTDELRSQVTDRNDWMVGNYDVFDAIYGVGTSTLDSVVAGMIMPGIGIDSSKVQGATRLGTFAKKGVAKAANGVLGGGLIGVEAAADTMYDLTERGASSSEAFTGGLVAGAFEGLFESFSIGEFKALQESGKAGLKNIVKDLAISAGVNGSEEGFTEIANIAYDTLANGDVSQYQQSLNNYMANGMSQEEAKKQVIKDMAFQVVEAIVSGAAQGLLMGGSGRAINSFNTSIADSFKGSEVSNPSGLLENIKETSTEKKLSELADKYATRIAEGKKVSNRQLGAIERKSIESTMNAKMDSASFDEILQGVSSKDRNTSQNREMAKIVQRYLDEKTISKNEENIIKTDPTTSEYIQNRESAESEFNKQNKIKALNTITSGAVKDKESTVKSSGTENNVVSGKNAESIKIADIKRTGTNKGENVSITVEATVDGEKVSVPIEEVEFANTKAADVVNLVADSVDLDTQTANYILNAAPMVKGASATMIAHYMNYAYTAGRYNLSEDYIPEEVATILGKDITEQLYKSGQSAKVTLTESESEIAKNVARGKKVKNANVIRYEGKEMGVKRITKDKTLTNVQKGSMIRGIALQKSIGVEAVFYKSKKNEDGKFVAIIDGKEVVDAPNGMYKNGKIYIDVNAGNLGEGTMLFTMSHELTHFIKQWSPAQFRKLADYVLPIVHADTDINYLVDKEIEKSKNTNNPLTREGAEEEIVANALESMLSDDKDTVINNLIGLKNEDEKLFKKIVSKISKWADEIHKFYNEMLEKGHLTSAGRAVAEMADDIDGLRDMFAEALKDAGKNFQSATVAEITDTLEGAKDTDGNSLFQYRAMEADEARYRQMLVEYGSLSKKQIDNLFDTVDKVVEKVKKNLEILDYDWEMDIDDRGFEPVKPNSDSLYKVSVDFSTLCRKRILQQAIQIQLQSALDRAITREESIAIRDELMKIQQEGKEIEIACALCYVESARMKSPAQIQNFLDDRRTIIKEFFANKDGGDTKQKKIDAEMSARKRLSKEYAKEIANGSMTDPMSYTLTKTGKKSYAALKSLPTSVAKEIRDAKREAVKSYEPTEEESKLLDVADNMSASDFTSPSGLENLAKNYRRLFDAYTSYVRNATKSKGLEKDTWWRAGDSLNKIPDSLIDSMNKENGLRSQSWSDFQVIHTLDYIAAVIELSTRNAKMQAYTKVPDYVKLMGLTNEMINLSLIPVVKFNGELEFDSVEGMDFEKALELRKKYHSTVGTICIGIKDKQIQMLLDSALIDYVIPYHQSGMSKVLRKAMHIPTWTSYESFQNDKKLDRKEAIANADKYKAKLLSESDKNYHKALNFSDWFDYNEAKVIVEKYKDSSLKLTDSEKQMKKKYGKMFGGYIAMQEMANRYKTMCAERGLAPKFSYCNSADAKTDFSQEENYWKLLIDRKMIDSVSGEIIEQKAVQPTFNQNDVLEILDDEIKRYPKVSADQDYATRVVVQKFLSGEMDSRIEAIEKVTGAVKKATDNITKVNILSSVADSNGTLIDGESKLSARDSDGNVLSEKQIEYFKNSKVRDENGNLLVLYSGSYTGGFTRFKNGRIWMTTNYNSAKAYGGASDGSVFAPSKDTNLSFDKYSAGKKYTVKTNDEKRSFVFDSKDEFEKFVKENGSFEDYISEEEYDELSGDIYFNGTSEDEKELNRKMSVSNAIRNAYKRYNRSKLKEFTVWELLSNPDAFSRDDFVNAVYSVDSNALVDEDGIDSKETLINFLNSFYEESDTNESIEEFFNLKTMARVPEGMSVERASLNDRHTVYKMYANIKNPYIVDNKGVRHNSKGSTYYESIDYAERNGYDGAVIKNVEVGPEGSGLGTVVVAFSPNEVDSVNNLNPTDNDDIRYSGRGNGYYGYSMSNNAKDAYDDGEMPLSKWTKSALMEAISEINPNKAELLKKVSGATLRSHLLEYTAWHHTSSQYNKTDFYKINEDVLESVTDSEIKEWESEKTPKKVTKKYKGNINYLTWSGSKAHPKATSHSLKDVNIEERGSFYVVTDDDGNELVRKKIGSNGTEVTNTESKPTQNYDSAKSVASSVETPVFEDYLGERIKTTSSSDVYKTYKEFKKIGLDFSRSGNIYPLGKKPSSSDYQNLSEFFKAGDKRISFANGYTSEDGFVVETWDGSKWTRSGDDIRYSFRGENSALTERDKNNLSIAKEMSDRGDDSEKIRLATGWFKGYDGKWRNEVDDSSSEFDKKGFGKFSRDKNAYIDIIANDSTITRYDEWKRLYDSGENAIVKVEDIYKNDELFNAYPELKDISVVFKAFNNDSYYGHFDEDSYRITLNYDLPNSKLRSTIAHELQHIVQTIEGFSKGGSPDDFDYTSDEIKIREAYKQAKSSHGDAQNDIAQKLGYDSFEQLENAYNDASAYNKYRKIAGEIESWDVENRLDLSTEQRKNTRPDIDRSDAIVKFSVRDVVDDDKISTVVKDGKTYAAISKLSLKALEKLVNNNMRMVNPSIGITDVRNPYVAFGDCAIVFDAKNFFDEDGLSEHFPVYDGDAYTYSYPPTVKFVNTRNLEDLLTEKYSDALSSDEMLDIIDDLQNIHITESEEENVSRTGNYILDYAIQNNESLAMNLLKAAPDSIKKLYSIIENTNESPTEERFNEHHGFGEIIATDKFKRFVKDKLVPMFSENKVFDYTARNFEYVSDPRGTYIDAEDLDKISRTMRRAEESSNTAENFGRKKFESLDELYSEKSRNELKEKRDGYYEIGARQIVEWGFNCIIAPDYIDAGLKDTIENYYDIPVYTYHKNENLDFEGYKQTARDVFADEENGSIRFSTRDRYEAKQGYVNKRNKDSRENSINVSEKQLDAIESLARIRHEIHTSWDSYWSGSQNWDYFDDESSNSINSILSEAGLPTINFSDFTDVPTVDDFYEILDDSERAEYNDDLNDWTENSGEYESFVRYMDSQNKLIEDYLRDFDKNHNTNYAPTGWSRFSTRDSFNAPSDIYSFYNNKIDESREMTMILNNLGENYTSMLGKVVPDDMQIRKLTSELIKQYNSKIDAKYLNDRIRATFDYMANTNILNWSQDIIPYLGQIAKEILEKSEMVDDSQYNADFRKWIRKTKIKINNFDSVKAEFGSWQDMNRMFMGKTILSTKEGTPIDELWDEMVSQSGGVLPAQGEFGKDRNGNSVPADSIQNMLILLDGYFNNTSKKVVNPYETGEIDIDRASVDIGLDLYRKYWDVAKHKDLGARYNNQMKYGYAELEDAKQKLYNEIERQKKEVIANSKKTLKQEIQSYKDARENTHRRQISKNDIERKVRYLQTRYEQKTNAKHIPKKYDELVKMMLRALPFNAPSMGGVVIDSGRVAEMCNMYRLVSGAKGSAIEDMVEENIDNLNSVAKNIDDNQIPFSRLTMSDYEAIGAVVDHIKFLVDNENKLFGENKKETIDAVSTRIRNELYENAELLKSKGKRVARDKGSNFFSKILKPEYLFAESGSDTLYEQYVTIRRGENKQGEILYKFREYAQEQKAKYKYDPRWKDRIINDGEGIKNDRGQVMELTIEEAMSVYALSNRPQGLQHLLGGGIQISRESKSKVPFKKVTDTIDYRLTENDIQKIVNTLTSAQKQYADALVSYMSKDIAKDRNEVTMAIMGIEKYVENYYFPIESSKDAIADNVQRTERNSSVSNVGSSKTLNKNAMNKVIVNGFTDTVNNHIAESAVYCGFAVESENLNRLWNSQTDDETKLLKSVIQETIGDTRTRAMKQFMVDLNSGAAKGNNLNIAERFTSKMKKASVMANISVIVQQPTAVFRAMLYVDPKNFATTIHKADTEEMYRMNGCAMMKQIGYFDVNLGRTVTNWLDEYSVDKAMKKNYSLAERWKQFNENGTLDELAGWGAEKADEITWTLIWNACKKQCNGDLNKACKLFQDTISKTQVYDSVFTKCELMRQKDLGSQMISAFMSEPVTSLNMLSKAIQDKSAGKVGGKIVARTLACYLGSLISNAMLKSLVQILRDDDDEKEFLVKYLTNIADNIAGDVFGMIPYLNSLYSILQGFSVERMDTEFFNAIVDGAKTIITESTSLTPDYEKMLSKALMGISQGVGIPVYNLYRDIKSVFTKGKKVLSPDKKESPNNLPEEIAKSIVDNFDFFNIGGKKVNGKIKKYVAGDYSLRNEILDDAESSEITKAIGELYKDGQITPSTAKHALVNLSYAKYNGDKNKRADTTIKGWNEKMKDN